MVDSNPRAAMKRHLAVLDRLELLPRDAMEEAARRAGGKHVEGNLHAVAAGTKVKPRGADPFTRRGSVYSAQ